MKQVFADGGFLQVWLASIDFPICVKVSNFLDEFLVKLLSEPKVDDKFHLLMSQFPCIHE